MNKQTSKNLSRKPRRAPKQCKSRYPHPVEFPQARGKMVEKIELSAGSDFYCILIHFQDDTDLTVVIDPWLTFRADYSRWKAGNQKVLKRWPVFPSDCM